MNKKTKGAIAAGAAALLLAGGASTFAAWNDTETVTGGTINSGKLQFVDGTAAGTWYDGATAISDVSAYRIVPGQTLTYKASPKVLLEGNNLTATITASAGTATGDLVGLLNIGTPTISGPGVTGTTIGTAANDKTLDVSVPVTFKADTTGLTGQGATAVLGTITLNLQQQ
ncbi:alternate-type signal peptide domain-containing protein [Prescottella subtropica]|uniref:alternate-type signal peptide domain-containing protein n=1 Tax=Prescottella subtropica TaxID=2545757 RepID=UPI0010F5A8BF|nr:alternate-type signal peptide domain-containing protein [Prescottella subtropica]